MSTRTPTDPRSSTDGRLAGATAARQLHREIAGSPDRARRVAVVGAGGSGKSVLLDVLDTAYRDGGVRVARAVPPAGEPLGPDVALVVDDVHLLPEAELDRLAAIAATPSARLVVAHRPWPRPPGLVALGALLAADRAPVVLGPLDRTGVAARAGLLLGQGVAAELVERVAAQTCGIPLLVDRLLAALAARPGPGVPPGLLAQLEYLVATVRPRVRALLRARAVGAPADPEILEPLLDLTGPDAHDLLDELAEEAAAAGLLTPDGAAIPLVSATVLAGTAPSRRVELVRFLAELELARGGDVAAAARGLLAAGATGTRAAAVLAAGADEAVRTGDRAAGELYAAAVRAGVPSLELAARRAEAALLAGDPDAALAHADEVLSAADRLPVADAVRAGTVAAAVFARRGLLARTAELHRWMGELTGAPSLLAVPALVGTGAADEARAALAAPPPSAPQPLRPPTLLAGAEELMARGVLDSVGGSPTAALSQLARAAGLLESSPRAALLPDTPAALAALVAVHCGELEVARSVLDRALAVDLGGSAARIRHRLLAAWITMQAGAIGPARVALTDVVAGAGRLEPRDELLAAGLDVALARRAADLPLLTAAWARAREAIVHHPVDLYALQPLGELVVAAARLRERSWVQPHLAEAQALLGRLDDPPLWAATVHWAGLHASLISEDAAEGDRHAAALERAADTGGGTTRYVTAMAVAARRWLELAAGTVDAAAVEVAARGLHAVGLTWEGGRLAGQAAVRTHDRRDMLALLGCARALQSGPAPAAATPVSLDPATAAAPPGDAADGALSDREREVAELVLEGLTYRQIGERLFISAKTVEYHVARMRQRLGSGSRSELFAQLRSLVDPSHRTSGP